MPAAAIATTPLYAGGGGGTSRKHVKVELMDASGAEVGVVKLRQQAGKVVVRGAGGRARARVPRVPRHVHSVGECVPPFTSAGGHYNPTGATHGDHAGDLPSLLVMEDGSAQLHFATDRFTVAELFDEDGTAIVVHAEHDGYANIPTRHQSTTEGVLGPDPATLATGDAGGRVACGVVDWSRRSRRRPRRTSRAGPDRCTVPSAGRAAREAAAATIRGGSAGAAPCAC